MAPVGEVRSILNNIQLEEWNALDLPLYQNPEEISDDNNNFTLVPLKQWRQNETGAIGVTPTDPTQHDRLKASLLRKVTVAYAISELLKHVAKNHDYSSQYSSLERICSIDNFVVWVSNVSEIGWEVAGLEIISPPLTLRINEDSFSSDFFFNKVGHLELSGRDVSATVLGDSGSKNNNTSAKVVESHLCHCVGVFLHKFFSDEESKNKINTRLEKQGDDEKCNSSGEPMTKKSSSSLPIISDIEFTSTISISESSGISKVNYGKPSDNVIFRHLGELGYPTSLSELVKDLIDCGLALFRRNDSYSTLELAISDLKLLLQYPGRFLFVNYDASSTIIKYRTGLYGRSFEARRISDAFCRVALTGESEALLIGGFSGCGKTSLVESVFEQVEAAGGYVVMEKFDEISSRRPLSVVLSAFNEFCISIAKNNNCDGLIDLYQKIVNEFGTNLHYLVRAVPSVLQILSAGGLNLSVGDDIGTQVNFHSLCFTIQRLMRITSSPSRPLLLVLDDLQWADPISLGLVHSVLSDPEGESCMFFVGTYRDYDLKPDHIIFGFVDMLSQFNVQSTDMHLDGLDEEYVGSMVSEILGILPRKCSSLADVVYRKTKGNPFFVLQFLRSLFDRGIVHYSLRERRWLWDIAEIGAEEITNNVLHLLSRKLTSLTLCEQTALKVASCFGMKMKTSFVQYLSGYGKVAVSKSAFNKLVDDGYMDCDGSHYRFVHDKVREAAYQLIGPDHIDAYHFEIGMEMMGKHVEDSDDLLATTDQINHGVPSMLQDESLRFAIAKLNYEAGLKSIHRSDYSLAHGYMKAAVLLLNDDSWTYHYVFSLGCYLHLAKAAFPCGCIDETKSSLNQIIKNGKCLNDKIDAYLMFVSVHLFLREMEEAIRTCIYVIGLLGECIPTGDIDTSLIESTILETKAMFDEKSGDNLLDLAVNEGKRSVDIMKFYCHLAMIAFASSPKLCSFYTALWARFAVSSKVHRKYAGAAFVGFGSCLCNGVKTDIMVGYRIGKMGLMCVNQCELTLEDLSRIHLLYYPNLGYLFEPFQACLDMHRQGYKSATQAGDTSLAASHFVYAIHREIISGENLLLTKAKIGDYLKGSKHYERLHWMLRMYYQVVLSLSGVDPPPGEQQMQSPFNEQLQCTQEIMTSLYNGHFERVKFLAKKWELLSAMNNNKVPSQVIFVALYSGLATTGSYRAKNLRKKKILRDIPGRLLPILTKAEECSKWNFKCKASLLRAEYLSLTLEGTKKCAEAELVYAEAISAAQSSRFVHEEGMACERAGMHYKQLGNHTKALALFRQAKKCYEHWGSQKRIDYLAYQISLICF